MPFTGFTKETIQFFIELGLNNNKEWFTAHKEDYTKRVLTPFQELVASLGPKMQSIDPDFEISPAVDKTISRIYRDTRFSKDKSPYKDHVWITFKRMVENWKEKPCFYFELRPTGAALGMGYFYFTPETRAILKEKILAHPADFKEAAGFLNKKGNSFKLGGERYKRPIDKELDEEIRQWIERKEMYIMDELKLDDTVFSPKLIDALFVRYQTLKPLYDFIYI